MVSSKFTGRLGTALAISTSALALCAANPAHSQDAASGQDVKPAPELAPPAKPASKKPQGNAGPAAGEAGDASGAGTAAVTLPPAAPSSDVDIIVTGIRQSLATAQNIKRNSDTVVDAITAQDIGSLPDRSINEALQRVPGIAISRFAAPGDSQHFSVEGSGVVIRGLSYVRGEFNGRDTFAANSGREISFSDVPTELAGSVQVFKNLTADLVEGGISGTVNINTRKPFDQNGQVIYLSGSMNYGDLAERGAPSVVGLYSNQWTTSGGSRIGVLVGGSYSQQYSRADSVFLTSFLPRFNAPDDGRDGYSPDDPNFTNFASGANDYQGTLFDGVLCDGNNPNEGRIINPGQPYAIKACDNFPVPAGLNTVYTPTGAGVRSQTFDRKRSSIQAAFQFENPDRTFQLTAQYLRAEGSQSWIEHTIETTTYYNDIGNTYPAGYLNQAGFPYNPNANYTYDKNGVFTGGTIIHKGNIQRHNTPTQCADIDANGYPTGGTTNYCAYPNFIPGGLNTGFSNRYNYGKSTTQDAAVNIKWDPTDRLHLNFDAQYVSSTATGFDEIVDTSTFTDVAVDLTGKVPQIQFLTPGFNTANYIGSGNSTFYNDAFNNIQINDGHEYAFRADAEYDFPDDSFLRAIRAGGRYAKRTQTVRTNDYNNWGSLSATWTDQGPRYLSDTPDATSTFFFDNFFRGQGVQPPAALYISPEILADHDALSALLRRAKDTTNPGQFSYTPLEDRGTNLIDGFFLPSEIYKNSEETLAGYVRADFGHEFNSGLKLSGNIGLRVVQTTDVSDGAINFPLRTQALPGQYADFASYCAAQTAENNQSPDPTTSNLPALCRPGVTAAQQNAVLAFANGASQADIARQKFYNWLPSLNLRLDVTPKLLFRFAASRAISRPNFGDLRNRTSLNFDGGNGVFTAYTSNPYLRPVEADQFDLTAEWYFAKVGQLTVAGFYKSLRNIILPNTGFLRSFTNGGVTQDLLLNGPANADGTGKIKGVEFSYQQTYDFLPGALNGLGVQATYTYIDAGSIPGAPPGFRPSNNLKGDGNQPPLDVTGLYDKLPLPGLSKHNFNVAVFYDKFNIYARVAYSWRSKFLLTNKDCCFPYLPVYSLATGQLDGSIFLTIDKHFKLGLEVQNILDATTKTTFLLNGQGLEAPRSYFKSDRQFQITARMTF